MAATDDVGGDAGDSGESVWVAEVQLYGDVVLRFVSTGGYDGAFLPGFEAEDGVRTDETFGLKRLDHLVGNVWELLPRANYVAQSTGLHQFAEFTAEDVGTVDSGLNSLVLASNDGNVLLPMNEPTYGTRRKSQIQTYLEQNEGEGVQHMALLTDDIFTTIRSIRSMTRFGGFQLMGRPSDAYYRELPGRLGDALTPDEYAQVEELGLLADLDDAGVLLQVFTRPVGDRPTLFLEIIQRIGCIDEKGAQEAGCGGFGKGNFRELFKSVEDFEASLKMS
uniref:4-hydroxyphenylpyruvate dioxygenase n=1 Tax=Florenciella parvula TaxID=236787 RepID=A0A6T7BA56_9STRA|mmetsp:Transcript_11654/g.24512  ORF Transcript_11654/g.24512 Transcript_11654/m.24512 type:complete len:278 (+) Transcript_11654:3-836(+)